MLHNVAGSNLPFPPLDVVEHREPFEKHIDVHVAAERIENRLDLLFSIVSTSRSRRGMSADALFVIIPCQAENPDFCEN